MERSVWVIFRILYPFCNLQHWGHNFWTVLKFSSYFDLAQHFSCSVKTVECGHMGKARDFKNHVTPAVFSFVVTSTYV